MRVRLARAGRQDDVVEIDRGAVIGVVRRHRLARRAAAGGRRVVVADHGVGQPRERPRRSAGQSHPRRIRFGQVEERRSGRLDLAPAAREGVVVEAGWEAGCVHGRHPR
jgi:hypothetical protein